MAFTLELSADYRGPHGRVVTDYHVHRCPNMPAALHTMNAMWERVSRRRGTQLHVRITGDAGLTITRTMRRD